MEFDPPLLMTVNALRSVLSHLCVRGIQHMGEADLNTLREAAAFFRRCNANHCADHIDQFLTARASVDASADGAQTAARHLLELQSRILLLERLYSRQRALEQLS
jgi:hypothetical protein